MRRRVLLIGAIGLLLFIAALAVDRPVAEWVQAHKPIKIKDWHWKIFKRPGDFQYLVPVVIVVGLFHSLRLRAALLLVTAAAVSGVIYCGKWFIGRMRPAFVVEPFTFHPFIRGLRGFFTAENLSFPSGHTCLAFAFASTLTFLYPRLGWLSYLVAAGVGIERVLEGAHYPSDVVAGALGGVLSGFLAILIGRRIFQIPRPEARQVAPVDRAAETAAMQV